MNFPLAARSGRTLFPQILRMLAAVVLLALGACAGSRPGASRASPSPAQPIPVEWNNLLWGAAVKGGWTVNNCTSALPSVCVQKDGDALGIVRLKDLPSLGEEKTTSRDQVQAVLAGRINSLYQFKNGRWEHACGKDFKVAVERPRRVVMGGHPAMKYELTGSVRGVVAETLVGFWSFRDGIETVIEASSAATGSCSGEPLGQIDTHDRGEPGGVFSPKGLSQFEPILDRMVAGSRLPPPTQFDAEAGQAP